LSIYQYISQIFFAYFILLLSQNYYLSKYILKLHFFTFIQMSKTLQAYNDKNVDFYRNIKMDMFQQIATMLGLQSGIDIEKVYPYIKDAKVLVELGAGYGRVVKALLKRGFTGQIIAVERVKTLFEYLSQNIPEIVVLQQQDLKQLKLATPPDAITWMWSGILELSKDEQKTVINNLYKVLAPKGVLIVEIPKQVKFVGVHVGEQKIKVETEWGTIDAYLPKHEEMLEYGKKAGFTEVQLIDYQTSIQLERSIYVFKK
jgi:SAM-dependent methyltransferase